MNITHVVESLGRGGLERMVIDLAEAQVNEGHTCQIICLFTDGELAQEAVSKGIDCVVCFKKKGLDFVALYRLRRALSKQKTEVIHSHNAVAHYYVYFAAQKLPIKCLINTRHGMGARNPNAKREKHYKNTLRKTNYVVAVCEAAKNKLVSDNIAPEEKCVVVRNGINVKQYINVRLNNDSRYDTVNNENKHLIIGSVGRLNWAKDYFTLLDSFKLLTAEFDDIKLVIVGGGELMEELLQHAENLMISEQVSFLGDTEDVKPILKNMDIFASSSVSEGYSIALLEACAAGIPIVATNVGGSSEIVQHEKNGLIVPPQDPEALAESLAILVRDKKIRDQYAIFGQEWILRNGDIDQMSSSYSKLYLEN